ATREKPEAVPIATAAPVEIESKTQNDKVVPRKISRRKKQRAQSLAKWEGLEPGIVDLEKSGSRLLYAIGSIRNATDRQRFSVTVELDLFDAHDAKVGSASDFAPLIEPRKEWNFKALVTDAAAVRAEVSALKEN
ncbi:MAG: FxLYD domain-containing protein, partial [Verrucomicrobiota bacterium]